MDERCEWSVRVKEVSEFMLMIAGDWSVWVREGKWSVWVREDEWSVWVKEGDWSVCVKEGKWSVWMKGVIGLCG